MAKLRRLGIGFAVIVAVAAVATLSFPIDSAKIGAVIGQESAGGTAVRYQLGEVSRGPIASTISASGTLRAVVTVDVGTQVSGKIETLSADFNSTVEAGKIIARIDAAPFEARLSEAEAELAVARATVAIQEASLQEFEAEMEGHRAAVAEAREDLKRKRELFSRKVETSSAVDTAVARQEQAASRVKAASARLAKQRAQIELARAQVLRAAAVVQQRRLDLEYTRIRSPVDGTVISRNVDAGQTVAASLQAPVLFRIAQDLTRMQVEISVDEADIGKVRVGQRVIFTVDSFPDRSFEGRVEQVRKAGQEISSVVTYTVVARAANEDELLLPGMTANATIIVEERDQALQLPYAAMRLRLPQRDVPAPSEGDWVWVVDGNGAPQPIPVVAGIFDGVRIEVAEGDLHEGQKVVVGIAAAPAASNTPWRRLGF